MSKTETLILCRSIFKNGAAATSKARYTSTWSELINQMERNKKSAAEKRMDKAE